MSGYIIAENANNVFYAYYRCRFWRWDDARSVWKESHLMAQKYERAKAALATLTPEDFLTNSAEFTQPDEYELETTMLDALKDAKPCKTAPIEPVKEESPAKYCGYNESHQCENEAGIRHFIKHGEIHGCAGCCPGCLNKDTCEYACTYVKPTKEKAECQTSTPDVSLSKSVSVPSGQNADTSSVSSELLPSGGNTSAAVASAASQCGAAAPTFDFSMLGDLSGQAAEADQQFDLHYGTAQDEYLISCIYLARIHALTAKAGRYGGGTWTKWYESKGLSEGSARTMVKNGEAFNSATVAELKCLPNLTRKDLNLIARNDCAAQLVETAGDSQRVQELLSQLKAKEAELNETSERLKSACIQEQESYAAMNAANARADEAESHYKAALADVNALAEANQQKNKELETVKRDLRAAKECYTVAKKNEEAQCKRLKELQEENEAIKKQPLVGVVDEEEVDRRIKEGSWKVAADMTAEFQAEKEQDARNAYDSILRTGRSIDNIWQTVKPLFRKMPAEQREDAANKLVHILAMIQAEVSKCL